MLAKAAGAGAGAGGGANSCNRPRMRANDASSWGSGMSGARARLARAVTGLAPG